MPTTKRLFPSSLLTACLAVALLTFLPAWAGANEIVDPTTIKTLDDELAEMADNMPGFGGWYVDERGQLNAYMTDLFTPEARSLQRENVRLEQGRFNFRELHDWKRDARSDLLATPGVLSLDIDESRNRIVVGVERQTSRANVRSVLATLDVPDDAVLIEEVEPVTFAATLRSYDKYRRGGLQIQYVNGLSTFSCTLGFIAYHEGTISPPPGYTDRGLVTASHCSSIQGTVDGTGFHHPTTSYSRFAHELVDPGFFTGNGCPTGRQCRFSDAAFATYHPLRGSGDYTIARTQSRHRTNGTLTLHSYSPKLTIAREELPNAPLGRWLNKMGRTSGWTYGPVNATCLDTNVAGSNITLLCQNRVLAGGQLGDSGGPVFQWQGDSYVTLHGVLWGIDGTHFYYSPLGLVEQELGPLRTSRLVPPVAKFSYTQTQSQGPLGATYSFNAGGSYDADGGSIQSYRWSFNGSIQTTTSSSVTRALPTGSNVVQLTVTDDEGATTSTTRYIYVYGEECDPFTICPFDDPL
ncbi:MAG: PKD domain-containing protein [Acidobacteriota bacterium]